MSDRNALVAAIAANPDEDTPRLALADYLDEHGTKAEQARAEFIRLQVRSETATGKAREKLVAAAEKLEAKHRNAWLKPLADVSNSMLPDDHVEFRRGLLHYTFLKTEDFLRKAAQQALPGALAAVGVEQLCFYSPTKRTADFANSPVLRFVSQIQYPGADDAMMTALATSPTCAHLSGFEFGEVAFTDKGLKAFAADSLTADVRRLVISTEGGLTSKKAKFTAAGVAALLNSDRLPRIEHLDLDVTSKFDTKPLFAAPGASKLRSLQLGPRVRVADLLASQHLTNLQSLCLLEADMTDADATALTGPGFAALTAVALNLNEPLSEAAEKKLRKRFGDGLMIETLDD